MNDVVYDEHEFDTINIGDKTFEFLLLIYFAVVAKVVAALKLGSPANICFLIFESLFVYYIVIIIFIYN